MVSSSRTVDASSSRYTYIWRHSNAMDGSKLCIGSWASYLPHTMHCRIVDISFIIVFNVNMRVTFGLFIIYYFVCELQFSILFLFIIHHQYVTLPCIIDIKRPQCLLFQSHVIFSVLGIMLNCIHIFIITGSFLYWCVMRPASQRFFIHSCIYVRILIISYLATFLGTNSLSVLMCRKTVNQSTWYSVLRVTSWELALTSSQWLHISSHMRRLTMHSLLIGRPSRYIWQWDGPFIIWTLRQNCA